MNMCCKILENTNVTSDRTFRQIGTQVSLYPLLSEFYPSQLLERKKERKKMRCKGQQ